MKANHLGEDRGPRAKPDLQQAQRLPLVMMKATMHIVMDSWPFIERCFKYR